MAGEQRDRRGNADLQQKIDLLQTELNGAKPREGVDAASSEYLDNRRDPRLPRGTYLAINRCNLPAQILGGLSFQQHPVSLLIDGVQALHHNLFQRLDRLPQPQQRVAQFCDYMTVHFRLDDPAAVGFAPGGRGRSKACWQRTIRGWLFDSDSREGAVLKGWVESRFGLLPRSHGGPIRDFSGKTYLAYLEARARGLYNTNALEAQLDLVYSFCQYQLTQRSNTSPALSTFSSTDHLTLYRGVNRLEQLERVNQQPEYVGQPVDLTPPVLLLNNLNSFSVDPERASEFGDQVIRVQVPRQKVFCFDQLFPSLLNGEGEYMVIGGLYRIDGWLY